MTVTLIDGDRLSNSLVGRGAYRVACSQVATTTTTTATTTPAAAPPVQPSEPALLDDAARAEITTAFETWLRERDTDALEPYIEDFATMRDIMEAAKSYAAQPVAGYYGRVDSITVLGADRAAVSYTMLHRGSSWSMTMPGEAVLADGRWVVTVDTVCDLYTRTTSLTCPPE